MSLVVMYGEKSLQGFFLTSLSVLSEDNITPAVEVPSTELCYI